MTDSDHPLRVLCVTPAGIAGRGGIDRLYYYLRHSAPPQAFPGITLRFAATRGDAEDARWLLTLPKHFTALILQLIRFRPQVVHVNFAGGASAWRKLAVVKLAAIAGARVAVHLHNSVPEAAIRAGTQQGRLFNAICAAADRVVVLGEPTAALLRQLGQPPEKLRVLLNGIPDFAADVTLPKRVESDVAILFAGYVGAHKGVGVLLEALAILAERRCGWYCVLAGNGEVETYAARASALGLGLRVRFTGWLDPAAMHALMRGADIVVLPSLAEALPLSLIEGACAGAALVATDVSNTREVVREGINGHLVARDPAALAATLEALLADPETRLRMQRASRRLYEERLTLEAFARDLGALYQELAGIEPARIDPDTPPAAERAGGSF